MYDRDVQARDARPAGDAGAIIGAAITRDSRTLATGSETGAVQLWDIPTGQALGAPLPGVSSSAVLPAFTPGGGTWSRRYATGRAYLWDIRPASLAKHACDVAGRRLTAPSGSSSSPGGLRPRLKQPQVLRRPPRTRLTRPASVVVSGRGRGRDLAWLRELRVAESDAIDRHSRAASGRSSSGSRAGRSLRGDGVERRAAPQGECFAQRALGDRV